MFALLLALFATAPDETPGFVRPPAGVVIPPARPGDPPIEITVPYNPDAATRADLEALAGRVDALEKAKANPCPAGCSCLYPGDCGEAGCRCRSAAEVTTVAQCTPKNPKPAARPKARPAPAPKAWYTLTNEPGVQGYGALDAQGRVVVERRRSLAGPFPVSLYQLGTYRPYAQPGLSPCAGGRCGR